MKNLQSRREFFKSAAKAALPVIGAAILASVPIVQVHADSCKECTNSCRGTCAECFAGCTSNCGYNCSGNCKQSCGDSCKKQTAAW